MSTTSSDTLQALLPELGESVTEGIIVEWRVAEGDSVEKDQTLLDLTTDKVDVEVPSPSAGRVVRLLAEAGDTVEVGAPLAEIATAGDVTEEATPEAASTNGDAPAEIVPIILGEMESVTEGVVVEWKKAEGDAVARDETIVEVSTDKVDLEVPSPADGTLVRISVPAGESFEVTAPLGEIAAGAGATPAPSTPAEAPAREAGKSDGALAPSKSWPEVAPLARRLAIERGVDLDRVTGSGPGGIIQRGDVLSAGSKGSPDGRAQKAASAQPLPDGAEPMRGPAAALAAYMDESLSIPTATTFRTVGVGLLEAQRKALNDDLKAADAGKKLTFTHIIAWAIVEAARKWPVMGTAFQRDEGTPHKIAREHVSLGLAVDVERKDGSRSLLVPVVRDADTLDFSAFVDSFADKVGRTVGGGITPDELQGASITLTNPGGLGTVASVPRLMPGQGTIVATGAIAHPAGLSNADPATLASLGVEKVMTMTSTYDHRVIQGAESGGFLADIDRLLNGEDKFYERLRESLRLPAVPAPSLTPVADLSEIAITREPGGEPDQELLAAVAAAMSLVETHRSHGHLAARLDPLGSEPHGDPALDPANLGLNEQSMAQIPASILGLEVPGETMAEALPHLRAAYCGTIAYEVEHISDHEQRVWLRQMIESGSLRQPLPNEQRVAVLEQLIKTDTMERYLRRAYLGQKTFSVEGLDTLIPIMNEIIEGSAELGASEVVIGMAHRGRLATITQVVRKSLESILAEFEGHAEYDLDPDSEEGFHEAAGDVKYHSGAEGLYVTRSGNSVTIKLASNPSHLEQVNAVAEGYTRARQSLREGSTLTHDPDVAVPLIVHGDGAFSGQGVVAETLNLSALSGYSTGGTIHVIANNQIGFTTDPNEARSTQHPSDLALGFDIPVIHVNADDVDACMAAVRLACAYRDRYKRDVLIDLIGYRRLGHNELDEPAYTQPVMYRTIKEHSPVSQLYAEQLKSEGVVSAGQVDGMISEYESELSAAQAKVAERGSPNNDRSTDEPSKPPPTWTSTAINTAVPAETLLRLNEELLHVPDWMTLHPKLAPQLERRRQAVGPEGGIVWAHAESLALSSLLVEGVPVRLTGQDAERGTFSQRHLVLHDVGEGDEYTPHTGPTFSPIAELSGARGAIEILNSPLSEAAAIGFEYGYSTQLPGALILWEAQYGDFANGAQIMIDQFLVSGRVKWGERSRLTLLLPHGYEGNGPEHSSARLERFLQLAAEDNIRVANPSTAAQYFHLLRRQALSKRVRPLVVMTPKSLLRLKSASSRLEELSGGAFQAVIHDAAVNEPAKVRRLILCSGKIAHELDAHESRQGRDDLAVARVELLYPFPIDELRELIAGFPNLQEVMWVQEEPRNMGAWEYMRRNGNLVALLPEGVALTYEGRPRRASTAEGYPQAHQSEQERVVHDAVNRS